MIDAEFSLQVVVVSTVIQLDLKKCTRDRAERIFGKCRRGVPSDATCGITELWWEPIRARVGAADSIKILTVVVDCSIRERESKPLSVVAVGRKLSSNIEASLIVRGGVLGEVERQ